MRFTPQAEYAFCQPLIRTVAYESQLKSDRAELHLRLAAAIEQNDPGSADKNAALIAEHLEAAGDLNAAYGWHMRAATWSTNRDTAAACLSWDRACRVADAVSADEPNRIAMRIAPRTLLCGNAWRVHENSLRSRFEELRQLCAVAGDKASLAIGMAGLAMDQWIHAHIREASRLASEYMTLVESIGDPTLTVGLAATAIPIKYKTGEIAEMLRWSQTAIDLADGDPAKGNFIFGSPLAVALATRGIARWWLGHPGWRDDFDHAIAMAHETDPLSHATVIVFKYVAIAYGVLLADKTALREIDEALQIAEGSADDFALGLTRLTKGLALMYTDPPDGELGVKVLGQLRDMCLRKRFYPSELPLVEIYTALDKARRGDIDHAIPRMRRAVDDYFHAGQLFDWFAATAIFVETLLSRGANGDVAEAEAAIDQLANAQDDNDSKACEIWLLRLRALLARAHGDEAAYRDYRDRYRAHGEIPWLRGTYRVGRGDAMTAAAPSGVVTFLFTDVEGSTRRWEADADVMRAALAAHDEVLRSAIETHGGFLFKHTGDGVCAAFASPRSAVDAAVAAQRALELPVRMGIATGEAELRGADYFGAVLNRAARVMAAGHGGQILLAESTAVLLSGVDLLDLGPRRLRDVPTPVGVFQVRAPGLQTEFPPLRALDTSPGNLRPPTTSFIGRESEVAEVQAAVKAHRLVTLTGVGGVGKTRLALEVAARLAEEFPDGVWFFDLAAVTDPAAVPDAVAAVLGITQQPGKSVSESVAAALEGRVAAVGVRQLRARASTAVADLVEAILAASATVTILATSREGLGVSDEQLWRGARRWTSAREPNRPR